ncbi:MAG: type 4a pilus biogenesis protein PilO [Terriglobia bacterium]
MKALSPKQKLVFVGLTFLFVLLTFVTVFYRPQINKLRDLRSQRVAEENQLKADQETAERLEDVKVELEKVQNKLKEFSAKIPMTEDFPLLLREVQRLANESGVTFMAMKTSPLEGQEKYAVLPLEITIDGYYKNVVDFLWRLNNLTREIKVTSLEVTEGEESLPNIEVMIVGSSFVLKDLGQEKGEETTETESSGDE